MDGRQVTRDRVTVNDEQVRWDCGSARPVGEAQPPAFFCCGHGLRGMPAWLLAGAQELKREDMLDATIRITPFI
jgi:hypothetical protein